MLSSSFFFFFFGGGVAYSFGSSYDQKINVDYYLG
jgi:hypothetical protein